MKIRTIKPDFWESEAVASCSLGARLTFIGLWNMADDIGTGKANTRLVKSNLWPLDDKVTPDDVGQFMVELANAGLVRIFTADDRLYYHVTGWDKHQATAYRRGEPQHPAPPDVQPARADVQESAGRISTAEVESAGREGKGKEGIGEEGIQLAPLARRDELFEALCHVCGIDWHLLTNPGRGPLNRALAELRGVGATPEEIERRAANWPYEATLTPSALSKHWASLGSAPPPKATSLRHQDHAAELMKEALREQAAG